MGRLIGDGALYCYIQDVAVHPDYRGQGIGSRMIRHLIQCAASWGTDGAPPFLGLVSAKGRESFYARLGFCPVPDAANGAEMVQAWKYGEMLK